MSVLESTPQNIVDGDAQIFRGRDLVRELGSVFRF